MKGSQAFFAGFFSVFGLCSFPFVQQAQNTARISVQESLAKDWQKVRLGLNTSFKKVISKVDGEKSEA